MTTRFPERTAARAGSRFFFKPIDKSRTREAITEACTESRDSSKTSRGFVTGLASFLIVWVMTLYARLSLVHHGGPWMPVFVHLQPLRRSMAPCSPMLTFSGAQAHARAVHHPWALHGAILRAAHCPYSTSPMYRNGGAQQRTVQERVEGWVAVPALPGLASAEP